MTDRIKLQIGMPVEMIERIDKIADEMGMTRSQLCAYFIGNGVRQTELQSSAISTMVAQLAPMMQQAVQQSVNQCGEETKS